MKTASSAFECSTLDRLLADSLTQRTRVFQEAGARVSACLGLIERAHRIGVTPGTRSPNPPNDPDAWMTRADETLQKVEQIDRQIGEWRKEADSVRQALGNFLIGLLDLITGRPRKKAIAELDARKQEAERQKQPLVAELQQSASALDSIVAFASDGVTQHLWGIGQRAQAAFDLFDPSVVSGWSSPRWESWEPQAVHAMPVMRLGQWVERSEEVLRGISVPTLRRALAAVPTFTVPAVVPFIGANKTVVLTYTKATEEEAVGWMQTLILRIAAMLPHHATFTLLDPTGYGRAFPMRGLLPRVTETKDDLYSDLHAIEGRVRHIVQNVLEMTPGFHLLPEATLASEPFEFVFASGFPKGYDRRCIETLFNLGMTGPRAGRYLFLLHNAETPLPRDLPWEALENRIVVGLGAGPEPLLSGFGFEPDRPPDAARQRVVLARLQGSKPRDHAILWTDVVDLPEDAWWRGDVQDIVRTPVGGEKAGLKIWFGVNEEGRPCAHGMLAAMTGQGKSNLYHALIMGLAVRYSPTDLHLYLVDGKDGVEFQVYRRLPHAAAVSLNSSAELSRSVLTELIEEKERRNELFARHGVTSFSAYWRAGLPGGPLPRILLLIDEYQELFEDDKEGVASQQVLQLAQQGRSVGIHLLLGSQRFGAPGLLNQTAVFGNFHLRMALKMTHEDVQALTAFGPAGKDLIRQCDMPGKVVINDQTGDDRGNVYGKVTKMPDDLGFILARIDRLTAKAAERGLTGRLPQTVVFNGADQPQLADNLQLRQTLAAGVRGRPNEREALARAGPAHGGFGAAGWVAEDRPLGLWLGQQFNVRGQAILILRRGLGQHAVVVGQDARARYGTLAGMLASLAVLYDPTEVRVEVIDRTVESMPEAGILERVCDELLRPAGIDTRYSREATSVDPLVQRLTDLLDERSRGDEMAAGPSVVVLLAEPDRLPQLRRPSDPYADPDGPTALAFQRLLVEGSQHRIHLILSVSGVRPLGSIADPRRGLQHIGHRVALQMSEDDSFALVGSRRAAQLQRHGPKPVAALYHDIEASDGGVRFKPYDGLEAAAQVAALADRVRTAGLGGEV